MFLKELSRKGLVTVLYDLNGTVHTLKGRVHQLNLRDQVLSLKDEREKVWPIRLSGIKEIHS
ncbi:hypothetical protein [Priestia koreensis]|uniref:hypothetical protein n=1 Tax=Priestia koreensis TaxID=284581 RepID=UPI001F59A816|nr:hypothetical protein [Priestia koreensis]MCM3006160.1 hypothetical protein [Priestia koreensis]UNL87019.1 hypothetical protein IE339_11260 [Priestia koreensis]